MAVTPAPDSEGSAPRTPKRPARPRRRPVGGFSAVDHSGSPTAYVEYLDEVRSLPHWQAWKAETIALLELTEGQAGLDLGCGTGEEVAAMASEVGPAGLALGVDASATMVAEAALRHRGPACRFLVADARKLPFDDTSFDGVRVERTLQHVADPAASLLELARVLRPGGRVVALEPDWETLVYSSPFEETSRAIGSYRIGLKPSRSIGRHLARLMAASGLVPEHVSGRVVTISSYEAARYAFNFEAAAAEAVRGGAITQGQADEWLGSLRAADAGGGFLAAVTNLVALGRKPS